MDECVDMTTRDVKLTMNSRQAWHLQQNTNLKKWPDNDDHQLSTPPAQKMPDYDAEYSFLTVPQDQLTVRSVDQKCLELIRANASQVPTQPSRQLTPEKHRKDSFLEDSF